MTAKSSRAAVKVPQPAPPAARTLVGKLGWRRKAGPSRHQLRKTTLATSRPANRSEGQVSFRCLVCHRKARRILLAQASRSGPEAVEICESARSRADPAAVDPTRVLAQVTWVGDTACGRLYTAASTLGTARTGTKGGRIAGPAPPAQGGAADSPGRVTNAGARAARSYAKTGLSGGQGHSRHCKSRCSRANSRAGHAPCLLVDEYLLSEDVLRNGHYGSR